MKNGQANSGSWISELMDLITACDKRFWIYKDMMKNSETSETELKND